MIIEGRQMAATLDGIRDDHVLRYHAAGTYLAGHVGPGASIIDVGCGCGYGSFILAREYGLQVASVDKSISALAFGRAYYPHPRITRCAVDCLDLAPLGRFDAATALEVIEHVPDGAQVLSEIAKVTDRLFGSVPNQDVVPFDPKRHTYHTRHYTPAEIREILKTTGWIVRFLGGQKGKHGADAAIGDSPADCATIVFAAERGGAE